jgi:hypothetical protein
MTKPATPTSKQQLSLELPSHSRQVKTENSAARVTTFVDAKTAKIRRQAIERVVASGIFSIRRSGGK